MSIHDIARFRHQTLNEVEIESSIAFGVSLARAISSLHSRDEDGIWGFALKNSYRPIVLKNSFNGLITNPPWLSMSRIKGNPFNDKVPRLADEYKLKPKSSAFLHLEMATVFLAHSLEQFLKDQAIFACILPETITRGMQHEPFRRQISLTDSDSKISADPDSIWIIDKDTFNVGAAVLFGKKNRRKSPLTRLPGLYISEFNQTEISLHPSNFGGRYTWSTSENQSPILNPYGSGVANQGADLMPRRLISAAVEKLSSETVSFHTPTIQDHANYLVKGAHNCKSFSVSSTTVSRRFHHKMWQSNHVAPFLLSTPADIVAPIVEDRGRFRVATSAEIFAHENDQRFFKKAISAGSYESAEQWFEKINLRNKLSKQELLIEKTSGYVILFCAGGAYPVASFFSISEFKDKLPLLDQTIYWFWVETIEEALYISGVLNAPQFKNLISPFIPEGKFKERHIHSLPMQVIPRFDPSDRRHSNVAEIVRCLIGELDDYISRNSSSQLEDPNLHLQTRRSKLRKIISSLPSSKKYQDAVHNVFKVS